MAMKQQTFASQLSFEKYGRKSGRELFLDEMALVVPWSELEALVEPPYPKAGNGRRPVGLGIMLRTYFMPQWFNLSDPGVEEALYESPTLRRFAGVDLGAAPAPEETTVLRFRHLLERHDLCGAMLDAVNLHLEAKGIRIATGTIVDATILHAPCSTRNEKEGARSRDAPDEERQAVVLRAEGAYRRGQQGRHGALFGDVGGQRVGHPPAGRPAARRGAQGMVRRRLPGPDEGHSAGRAQGPGHDLEKNEVQELCG